LNKNETIIIFGLGLIGRQRLDACVRYGIKPSNIFAYDPNIFALGLEGNRNYTGVNFLSKLDMASDFTTDRAIVAVPHDLSGPIVKNLLNRGTKVLLEKPLGRNLEEAESLATHKKADRLSLGFNYRFMPGIMKLKEALDNGQLGNLSTLRLELGHGGAPKDLNSWKIDPIRSGGGVTLDPGIHLVDLLIYLFSASESTLKISGKTEWKGFWKTGVEESLNLIGYSGDMPFNMTASIVAWRTRFSIEVIGTEGYFEVDGRGRSDGPQRITEGTRWGWLSAASQKESEVVSEVAKLDNSLINETHAWLRGSKEVCTIIQALEGMKIYAKIKEFRHEL
jgi:predicted dehydrogenase